MAGILKRTTSPMEVEYGSIAKVITAESKEMEEVYRLRYQRIVEDLKWLPPNQEQMEKDRYDDREKTLHFGVWSDFQGDPELISYLRIIVGDLQDWMLGNEFSPLLTGKSLPITAGRSLEISRLVTRRSKDVPVEVKKMAVRSLYRHLVAWAYPRGIVQWWMVVTNYLARDLESRNFVLNRVYEAPMVQNGPSCMVVWIDLQKTKEKLAISLPQDHEWYFGDVI